MAVVKPAWCHRRALPCPLALESPCRAADTVPGCLAGLPSSGSRRSYPHSAGRHLIIGAGRCRAAERDRWASRDGAALPRLGDERRMTAELGTARQRVGVGQFQRPPSRRRRILLLLLLLTVALAVAAGWLALSLLGAARDARDAAGDARSQLGRAATALRAGDDATARQAVKAARGDLDLAEAAAGRAPVRIAGHLPLLAEPVSDLDHLLAAGRILVDTADRVVGVEGRVRGDALFHGGRIDLTLAAATTRDAKQLLGGVERARTELDQVRAGPLSPGAGAARDATVRQLNQVEGQVRPVVALLDALPGAVGANGSRTYLVAVMNSAESKAWGGSPLAVALLRFDHGAVSVVQRGQVGEQRRHAAPGALPRRGRQGPAPAALLPRPAPAAGRAGSPPRRRAVAGAAGLRGRVHAEHQRQQGGRLPAARHRAAGLAAARRLGPRGPLGPPGQRRSRRADARPAGLLHQLRDVPVHRLPSRPRRQADRHGRRQGRPLGPVPRAWPPGCPLHPAAAARPGAHRHGDLRPPRRGRADRDGPALPPGRRQPADRPAHQLPPGGGAAQGLRRDPAARLEGRRRRGRHHHPAHQRRRPPPGAAAPVLTRRQDAGVAGSTKRMVVPLPGSLSAVIVPPCASTRLFAIASPSPAPPESADFTKRWNTCGRSSRAMPDPVSLTVKATPPADGSSATSTEPPRGVWRMALDSRFASTSPTRSGSTSSSGRAAAARQPSVTPVETAPAR